jgi:hypothetical protein
MTGIVIIGMFDMIGMVVKIVMIGMTSSIGMIGMICFFCFVILLFAQASYTSWWTYISSAQLGVMCTISQSIYPASTCRCSARYGWNESRYYIFYGYGFTRLVENRRFMGLRLRYDTRKTPRTVSYKP